MTLVLAMMTLNVPVAAFADIHELDKDWVTSSTNPGDPTDYSAVWREGWGNEPLAQFDMKIPQPNPDQPAIVGAYYYLNRPGSLPGTITAAWWPQSYMAPISDGENWKLYLDVAGEIASPGQLFDNLWLPTVVPDRAYEGPFDVFVHFYARNTTDAAAGQVRFGLDVTPPIKVTGLQAKAGASSPAVNGWLTQSRALFTWDDILYDRLSGTGYFEAFIDGKPYPLSADKPDVSRKVYDLKEHYSADYGDPVATKREMVLEDLPAGVHKIQIRAVDRATNAGPLSDEFEIKVDPDFPKIEVKSPLVDGEPMGARPTFVADVSDKGSVAWVKFYVDGVLIANDTVAPYSATVDLSAFADGSTHVLRVEAEDGVGRPNFVEKQFTIDKKPQVKLVSPSASGQVFSRLVPLKVVATDRTGVSSVSFAVDDASVANYSPATSDVTTLPLTMLRELSPGVHSLDVTVTGAYGGVATATADFSVNGSLRPNLDEFKTLTEEGEAAKSFSGQWFNTVYPKFSVVDDDSIANPTELLYAIDRTPMTRINPALPNLYYSSMRVGDGTTLYGGVIDQRGVLGSNPVALDGEAQFSTGVNDPVEGIWYTHAKLRNGAGASGSDIHTSYGVDLTKPSQIATIAAYSDAASQTPATQWLDQSRVVLRWNGTEHDGLSGTEFYNVYIDGVPVDSGSQRIAFETGRDVMSLTLEDVSPGQHDVTVTSVDRAGNESDPSAPFRLRIKSVPAVDILAPASSDTTVATPVNLRAMVRDASGIELVEFAVDGSVVASFTPASVDATTLACNTYRPLPTGQYSLTVTAKSVSGLSRAVSKTFKVDSTLRPDIEVPDGEVETAVSWFNNGFPTFAVNKSTVPTDPAEMLYIVDRSPFTVIDPAFPNDYNASFRIDEGTTYFSGLIDQWGVYRSNPAVFDGALQMFDRVTSPIEGLWYIHSLLREVDGDAGPSTTTMYGVDITKPSKVESVAVYSDSITPATPGGWLNQSRVVIDWNGSERDALSGTDYYRVYIDDVVLGGSEHRIAFQSGRQTMSVTVEDMTPGEHSVQVTAVDLAGNESAKSDTVVVKVDTDLPVVTITSPAADNDKVGAKPTFTADASDASGIQAVRFLVDGVEIGSDTQAPYSYAADLSAMADGSAHVLTVVAEDKAGRTTPAIRPFVIDKKPSLTYLSPAVPGEVFSRLVPLKIQASDHVGLNTVLMEVDGLPVASYIAGAPDTTSTVLGAVGYYTPGLHTLAVTVTNSTGVTLTSTRAFSVNIGLRPALSRFAAGAADDADVTSFVSKWFNTRYPTFTAVTDKSVSNPTEMLYLVDRDPMTTINSATPNAYYASMRTAAGTTYFEGLIDQFGVYLSDVAAFDATVNTPAIASDPIEGIWYTHAKIRNAAGDSTPDIHTVYGVDLTKPAIVTGVGLFTDNAGTVASGWLDQSRVVLQWSGLERDALSGTEFFNVYVDGERLGLTTERIAFQPGRNLMSLTLEDLSAGPHRIQVTAVDRAGNESDRSTTVVAQIKSTPTVEIIAPSSTVATVSTPVNLRTLARDLSGIASVDYYIDGVLIRSFPAPSVNATTVASQMFHPLTTGTYTLTVTATSVSGPSKSLSRTFNVDATLPPDIEDPDTGGGTPSPVTPTMKWFNTAFPTFTVNKSDQPTDPVELLYLVDRNLITDIDPTDPNAYYSSYAIEDGTTLMNGVIDQWGVYKSNAAVFDGALQLFDRVSTPIEGIWYIHSLLREADGDSGAVAHSSYGVDVTRPMMVEDVALYASNSAALPVSGWLDQSRVVIRWDGSQRDRLSGTAFYNIYVDGELVTTEEKVAYQTGRPTMSLTLEDLEPGTHKIEVTAVDQAGNESLRSAPAVIRMDSDIPGVKIITPATQGAKLGLSSTLSVLATDQVSVRSVNFRIDGSSVGTVSATGLDTSFTANLKPAWANLSSGDHELTVFVTDHVGHVASDTRSFVLDKTAPVISTVSGAPSPFYPRKRDGYKDNFTVKLKSSEAATAKLTIKDSTGKVWRTISKSVPSGSSSLVWNGKSTSGSMKAGTFRWSVQLTDPSGNTSKSVSGSVAIKYYEVVRTGTSTVRVIAR